MKTLTVQEFDKNKAITVDSFYHAILIYLKKPQVVNRKLSTVKNLLSVKIKADKLNSFLDVVKSCEEIQEASLLNALTVSQVGHEKVKIEDEVCHLSEESDDLLVSLDKIIPRNANQNQFCHQAAVICTRSSTVTFHKFADSSNILPSVSSYAFKFFNDQFQLLVDDQTPDSATNWLQFALFKKLFSWMESYDGSSSERLESHSLIDDERYSQLYAQLKEKYGKKFEEIWTEEVTDPKKYIYEDIAIACYLLTLWEQERIKTNSMKKQTFMDLGCGNGLLVVILSLEGHEGYGIDLRRRKIWSKFDSCVDLREAAWTPESELDQVDWVIGNHSDELSPWIPVVAARNSKTTKYFLLPCCAYEFSGARYQRRGTAKSLYMSFIDFCAEISSICGFKETFVDRLKIPSTKRICLIGTERSDDEDSIENIQKFIDSSNKEFLPREKEQSVRNCTKIDRNLKERIIRTIFDALLEEEKLKEGEWNCGREIHLSDAVKLISDEDLKKLKAEHGGLKTLLKNKHQIFEVQKGCLRIRKPTKISERKISKKVVLKSSPCYFHLYHKQGCLLKEEDCCYQH